jgi:hypothetical protein
VTPAIPPPVLDFLRGGDAKASMSVGAIAFAVLVVGLAAKVMLQSVLLSARPSRRDDVLRLLTILTAPLLLVFALIIVERFHDLS